MTIAFLVGFSIVILAQGFTVNWYVRQLHSADQRASKEAELVMIVALAHYMADGAEDRSDVWDALDFDTQLDFQRDAKNWLQGFYRSRMEAQA